MKNFKRIFALLLTIGIVSAVAASGYNAADDLPQNSGKSNSNSSDLNSANSNSNESKKTKPRKPPQ